VKILGKGPGLGGWPQVGRKENRHFPCNTKQGCFGNKQKMGKDHAPMGWKLPSPGMHLGWTKGDFPNPTFILQHQVPRGKRTITNSSHTSVVPWFPRFCFALTGVISANLSKDVSTQPTECSTFYPFYKWETHHPRR